jgi:hypothetical protein
MPEHLSLSERFCPQEEQANSKKGYCKHCLTSSLDPSRVEETLAGSSNVLRITRHSMVMDFSYALAK